MSDDTEKPEVETESPTDQDRGKGTGEPTVEEPVGDEGSLGDQGSENAEVAEQEDEGTAKTTRTGRSRYVMPALLLALVAAVAWLAVSLWTDDEESGPELALSNSIRFEQAIQAILEGQSSRLYTPDFEVNDAMLATLPLEKLKADFAARQQFEAELASETEQPAVKESADSQTGSESRPPQENGTEPPPVFASLDTVLLDQGIVSDEGLAVLAELPELSHLRLRKSPITDQGIEVLLSCHTLWNLNLPHSQLSSDGIRKLVELPRLRQLRLGSPKLTNEAARAIAEIKRLRGLHLIGVPITDEGLKELVSLPHLESLYLDDTAITEAGWDWLFRNHPQLHVHINQRHHDRDPKAHSHE